MNAALDILRAMVRPILEKPDDLVWEVQGLGMLRTKLSNTVRMHIWDSRLKYCEDSGWHTHPWDFSSFIVTGAVINTLYIENREPVHGRMIAEDRWHPFSKRRIICGPDGCVLSPDEACYLFAATSAEYTAGMSYSQTADEIHATRFREGTISIITRKTIYADGSANIYTPAGHDWSNAGARAATEREKIQGKALALSLLNQEEGIT